MRALPSKSGPNPSRQQQAPGDGCFQKDIVMKRPPAKGTQSEKWLAQPIGVADGYKHKTAQTLDWHYELKSVADHRARSVWVGTEGTDYRIELRYTKDRRLPGLTVTSPQPPEQEL